MEAKADYYRQQAHRCRDLARGTTDWSIRQTLLDAALEYDKLAERADKKHNKGIGPVRCRYQPGPLPSGQTNKP